MKKLISLGSTLCFKGREGILQDHWSKMSVIWLKIFRFTKKKRCKLTYLQNRNRLTPHRKQTCGYPRGTAKLPQLCLTLCDPIDGSPPGFPIPGILQARTLEWVPFPSPVHESEKWKWSRSVVSDPQRPHGLQPTRLLHPWDFPGKSTGVGCHCLLLPKGNREREIRNLGLINTHYYV